MPVTARRAAAVEAVRGERAEDTRQRLIAAAMKVFARYGYRQASMATLALEVQMSRQSLYNHFPNKDAIFVAAVQALQDMALAAATRAADARRAEGADALAELVAALATRMVVFNQALQGTPHLGELVDEQGRLCGQTVAQGHADFRSMLLQRVQAQRARGKFKLPRSLSSEHFVDDAMTVALGLKHGEQGTDAAAMTQRLERLLRWMVQGMNAPHV
jgi:AcrR family transcriptional regulator